MERKPAQRRLAAILAADVVGYSRLMSVDEMGTLTSLKAHRAWGRRKDVTVFGCSDDCARCGTAKVHRMPTNA